MFGKGRARALELAQSMVEGIEKHLKILERDPYDRARDHPAREVEAWLAEAEGNLRFTGIRTGREWRERVDEWRRRLNQARER